MKLTTSVWALVLLLSASGAALRAESVAATADQVSGNVYATSPSGKSTKIEEGAVIPAGSLVHTNANSSVRLKLVPGAITVVTAGSDVVLTTLKYSVAKNGDKLRTIKLTLRQGQLVCSLAKHDGNSNFSIVTPMGTTKARGTDWAVSFSPSAGVSVATADGVVQVTLPNGKVVLVPGGQVTTSPNGTTIVTGNLTPGQIHEIVTALNGGGKGSGGGGTFTITPLSSRLSNPANTSTNTTVSPNQ